MLSVWARIFIGEISFGLAFQTDVVVFGDVSEGQDNPDDSFYLSSVQV